MCANDMWARPQRSGSFATRQVRRCNVQKPQAQFIDYLVGHEVRPKPRRQSGRREPQTGTSLSCSARRCSSRVTSGVCSGVTCSLKDYTPSLAIRPLGCPPWSTEQESNQTRTHDSYTTPRDAIGYCQWPCHPARKGHQRIGPRADYMHLSDVSGVRVPQVFSARLPHTANEAESRVVTVDSSQASISICNQSRAHCWCKL
jgi:hypothetical protein